MAEILNQIGLSGLLTVLTPIIGATLAFIYWKNQFQHKRYNEQLEKSLENLISPLYQDLIHIWINYKKNNAQSFHNNDLEKLFNEYLKRETKLFLSLDPEVIERMSKNYKQFQMGTFSISEFAKFSRVVEDEYWELYNSYTSEHQYQKRYKKRKVFWRLTIKGVNYINFLLESILTITIWALILIWILKLGEVVGSEIVWLALLILAIGGVAIYISKGCQMLLNDFVIKKTVDNKKIINELTQPMLDPTLSEKVYSFFEEILLFWKNVIEIKLEKNKARKKKSK
ncbi:hypothetical protein HXZ66_15685 [Bacillus sp. A116_S68]|jgi:hypothetical protein|nr:hypothetical protein HXZ66_15685 [Bacillus sp. A116_S68]